MTSLHVFILLSLTGAMSALPLDPVARVIREVAVGDIAEDLDVGDIIQTANTNLGHARGDPHIMFGDIAMPNRRNAHPCTQRGCLWPRLYNSISNVNVYIPLIISDAFSREQRNTIIRGLISFHASTCIRFTWRSTQRDYLNIYPGTGCWSYVGRQGGSQKISLQSRGCVYKSTIQHEVLHALGLTHEQNRSDRDEHVTIVTDNIQPGMEHNFRITDTNNLATPYDYNSVMHYSIYAFSRDWGNLATIVPKPDASVTVGGAKEMSENDILRINRLYCSPEAQRFY